MVTIRPWQYVSIHSIQLGKSLAVFKNTSVNIGDIVYLENGVLFYKVEHDVSTLFNSYYETISYLYHMLTSTNTASDINTLYLTPSYKKLI